MRILGFLAGEQEQNTAGVTMGSRFSIKARVSDRGNLLLLLAVFICQRAGCLLSGVKRKSNLAHLMSAFDP